MKKNYMMKLLSLLISAILILSLTACGGKSDDVEEIGAPTGEEDYQSEETSEEENPEEAGPKEVSAIDMNTTYEWQGTYFDEDEGYDREYSTTCTESLKLIDYKVFPNTESSSCIVALHFKQSVDIKAVDAKGNEIPDWGIDWLELDYGYDSQEVINKDTGETEEIDFCDYPDTDTLNSYEYDPVGYEGLDKYLKEVDYENEVGSGDDGIRSGSTDIYSFYRLEYNNGVVSFYAENRAFDEDECTVTSYNDAKQIMKIEL